MDTPAHQPTSQEPADPRLAQLEGVLRRVQLRLRLVEAARLAPYAALAGLSAALVLVIVWRFRQTLSVEGLLLAGGGFVAAALLTVLLYALLRPRTLMQTALRTDALLHLDERLSTALEDAVRPSQPGMQALQEAQLGDALQVASRISPAKDLPLSVRRDQMWPLLGMLALLAVAIFAPNPLSGSVDPAVQAQIQAEKAQLEQVQKQIGALPNARTDPTLKAVQDELVALQNDLSRQAITQAEAVARLSDAESKLEKSLDPQAPAERAALQQLAQQLAASGNSDAKAAGKALQQGDAKEAAGKLQQAGKAASSMSPGARQALSDTLRQAQSSVASLDPQLAGSLNDAANALNSSDPNATQQALQNLGQSVQDKSGQLATQQQVEQALSQIQSSKSNIAQTGNNAQASSNNSSTPQTSISGTAVALNGTPPALGTGVAGSGTAQSAGGTAVALGSQVAGQLSATGTPVLVPSTPGKGTPVTAQGSQQGQAGQAGQAGQSGQSGQNGQNGSRGQNGQPGSNWGVGHNEPVYAPTGGVNASLTPVTLQGQQNPNGEQTTTNTNTGANSTNPASVPYEQVYGQYREQAGNALNSNYIPQGYKDMVRDYFNGIAPTVQP